VRRKSVSLFIGCTPLVSLIRADFFADTGGKMTRGRSRRIADASLKLR